MRINKYFEGLKTEQKFCDLMISRNNTCVKSSVAEDVKKHIDFYVNDESVEVKGNRYLNTIWLELKNVRGEDGWLLCCAKYIVFDVVDIKSFCFYERQDLYDYVKNISEIAKDKHEYKKLYTRKNRKDVIVKVTYDDIKHLIKQTIKYD